MIWISEFDDVIAARIRHDHFLVATQEGHFPRLRDILDQQFSL